MRPSVATKTIFPDQVPGGKGEGLRGEGAGSWVGACLVSSATFSYFIGDDQAHGPVPCEDIRVRVGNNESTDPI